MDKMREYLELKAKIAEKELKIYLTERKADDYRRHLGYLKNELVKLELKMNKES